jgi:hypothetical protein
LSRVHLGLICLLLGVVLLAKLIKLLLNHILLLVVHDFVCLAHLLLLLLLQIGICSALDKLIVTRVESLAIGWAERFLLAHRCCLLFLSACVGLPELV